VAILSGGFATRLRPVTERIPKSLIEVAGKPFLVHQIELLKKNQLTELVLCVGHLGEMIQQQIGNGCSLGVEIEYVFDGAEPLGTGGALRHALPALGESFFVLYGDSYLQADYQQMRQAFGRCEKRGMMSVFKNCGQWDHSNVELRDGQILSYDKRQPSGRAQHIDYGINLLRSIALEHFPTNRPFDLAEVFQRLIAEEQMAGFEVFERFYEIGSPAGLEETRAYLSRSGKS
jgi:NDP-sugar pyrophosphorylase family protein